MQEERKQARNAGRNERRKINFWEEFIQKMENAYFEICSEKETLKKKSFPTSLQIYFHNQFLKNFYMVKDNRLTLLYIC